MCGIYNIVILLFAFVTQKNVYAKQLTYITIQNAITVTVIESEHDCQE